MRVVSINLNGIRSAERKGFFRWLDRIEPWDMVCVQELKAHEQDLSEVHRHAHCSHAYFHAALKRGYSGVGLYARNKPERIRTGFGSAEFDGEGRYLRADFGKLSVISVYLPSGSSSEERQQAKFRFLDEFLPHLRALRRARREIILCGDWNIAHQEIDLKNWRGNRKNSGFLPEERDWIGRVFAELGWVDVYRRLHPEATSECYTWWSNRGQAWAKNVGWRIDYQIATPGIAKTAKAVSVYKENRFSDHAPLIIDYDWPAANASAS
jgi:exodeoxyribonuclease-3